MILQNRIALITGAGRGIGAAIAKRFAREGAIVIAADVKEEWAQAVVDEIRAAGGRAEAAGIVEEAHIRTSLSRMRRSRRSWRSENPIVRTQ